MKYNFHTKRFDCIDENATKIAIAGSDGDIDWINLKKRVESFAALLSNLNIPPGHPIIIYGHKELLFPISILACILSEITYIPVDVVYPIERIKRIQQMTGSQICINCTSSNLDIDFSIIVDKNSRLIHHKAPDYGNNTYPIPNDILQYIMFTSGSTGEPKGVQIAYSSILEFVQWAEQDFSITSTDVIMSQALFSFDLSMWDLLVSMSSGATLVLMPEHINKNQELFIKRLTKYNCTVWSSTPSFVFMFLRNPLFDTINIKSLQRFYMMGESLSPSIVVSLKKSFAESRIYNAYGPTEATIITSMVEITNDMLTKYPLLPVGYKMPKSKMWIASETQESEDGEICISGNHVSVGYFKNNELNKHKFFLHNNQRAFRTGDVGYYQDGLFFLKHRKDDQIKLHGYRIELDEITSVICKFSAVTNAVTLPLKRNNEVKKIISFIITDKSKSDNIIINELTDQLKQKLPHYMIPGDIVIVPEFPYNVSHKIDKNKLIQDYLNKMLQ